jgi:hypothetical protein
MLITRVKIKEREVFNVESNGEIIASIEFTDECGVNINFDENLKPKDLATIYRCVKSFKKSKNT